jgi:hypothetical protein
MEISDKVPDKDTPTAGETKAEVAEASAEKAEVLYTPAGRRINGSRTTATGLVI